MDQSEETQRDWKNMWKKKKTLDETNETSQGSKWWWRQRKAKAKENNVNIGDEWGEWLKTKKWNSDVFADLQGEREEKRRRRSAETERDPKKKKNNTLKSWQNLWKKIKKIRKKN